MTTALYPVILAGGSGTRLWPLSRHNFPKQFLKLNGELSLLQHTIARVQQLTTDKALIVSNDAHYFLCQEQLSSPISSLQLHYLLEPCMRNTAPAIACAAHYVVQHVDPEAILVVLPSDHWIADNQAWQHAIMLGQQYAQAHDAIVTFGITPTAAHTGYGYIEAGESLTLGAQRIIRFCEKPKLAQAKEFITQGNYYWNSGMFVCKARVYLAELQQFERAMHKATMLALTHGKQHHDFLRLDLEHYAACRSESIDYAVMEKTTNAVVIPMTLAWSDLGCWSAVAATHAVDDKGNSIAGKAIVQNSGNCLIHSDELLVTALGIHDQIIIATRDAVLVADKAYSQQVKELVQSLPKEHHALTQDHPRVIRPWGYYEILAEGPAFKVKRLMVKPGAKISLQMHQHRAEHWVVVAGKAEVIHDERLIYLAVNQSIYIPERTKHRLSNPGGEALYVIEVQSGSYLGEDDITRFDDVYARATVAL